MFLVLSNFNFEYFAVQTKKDSKIHFSQKSEMTDCGQRIKFKTSTVDEIENYLTFVSILKDENLCLKCKKDMLEVLKRGECYFKTSGSEILQQYENL